MNTKFLVVIVFLLCFGLSVAHANTVFSLDPCESSTSLWQTPFGGSEPFDFQPYSSDRVQGSYSFRAEFASNLYAICYALFSPGTGFGDHDYLTFWLKAVDTGYSDKSNWLLRLTSDSETDQNDSRMATIDKWINLDFDGWTQVRLRKEDFEFHTAGAYDWSGSAFDWTRFKKFSFGLMEVMNESKPTILIDDICYEDEDAPSVSPAADSVVISNCESTSGWTTQGIVTISASADQHQEGSYCLWEHYSGQGSGSTSVSVPQYVYTGGHALTFKLRGAGTSATAKCYVVATSSNGAYYRKQLPINNTSWVDYQLFPNDFKRYQNSSGYLPEWENLSTVKFEIVNSSSSEQGDVLIDAVKMNKVVAYAAIVSNPDPDFWWWNGGFDPYAAMHSYQIEWSRLHSDPNRHAFLEYSEFMLSPLVPYTVYIDNSTTYYPTLRLTITDWQLNTVRYIEITNAQQSEIQLNLVTPAKAGTYLHYLQGIDQYGALAQQCRTGIMVLPKRLSEVGGYWGIHGYIGQKGQSWPHHDVVLRQFQEVGITALRERLGLPRYDLCDPQFSPCDLTETPTYKVCELAYSRNIEIDMAVERFADTSYFVNGDYTQGVLSSQLSRFRTDWQDLATTYAGLVDWYEYGNEPNGSGADFDEYANSLFDVYDYAKQGDSTCGVLMGGSGTWNDWQTQLYDLENQRSDRCQDALATHLYPQPATLELSMRTWINDLNEDNALDVRGMMMTEGGLVTFDQGLQSLVKAGMPPKNGGESSSQEFYAMYAPLILGECMQNDALLHGCYFFQAVNTMGDWVFDDMDDLYVYSTGHFAGMWNTRELSVGRPMAYTHNAIARLLTNEVQPASVTVTWNSSLGKVEDYAFSRPGETIVALWSGLRAGMRTDGLTATVTVPSSVGLVLLVDVNGDERILTPSSGTVQVVLQAHKPVFLRMIDGTWNGNVFLQGLSDMPAGGFAIMQGTPEGNSQLVEGISRDRNLPTISDVVPAEGYPMALYSQKNNTLYIVGKTDADVTTAANAFRSNQLLLTDGYSVHANCTEVNDELVREDGPESTLSYAEYEHTIWRAHVGGPTSSYAKDALVMLTNGESYPSSGTAGVKLNYNFENNNSFTLKVDVDPVVESTSTFPTGYNPNSDWIAVKFGTNYEDWVLTNGVVFKLCHSGAWEAYWQGVLKASGSVTPKTGYYSLKFTVSQAGDTDPATVNAYIDGVNVWSNCTISGGLQNNKISMISYGPMEWGNYSGIMEIHAWDNFNMSSGISSPSLLFSDNYTSWSSYDNLTDGRYWTRQGGQLIGSKYTEYEHTVWRAHVGGPASSYKPEALVLLTNGETNPGSGTAGVRLNYNFDNYNTFVLSADVDPVVESTSAFPPGYDYSPDWLAVKFGTNYEDWVLTNGVVFKLHHSGFWEAFWNGSLISSATVSSHTGYYNLRFEVTQDGDNDPAVVKAYIDGVNVWTYTISSGLQNNKISFISACPMQWGFSGLEVHAVDNLSVSCSILPQ